VPFSILFSSVAAAQLRQLEKDRGLAKRLKSARKTIARLEVDPRHPALQTHRFRSLTGPNGEEVFESYAEQGTPAAYRVFWFYGSQKGQITILAITKHP
jgi:hypothetical protein